MGSDQNRRRRVPRLLVLATALSLAGAVVAGCGSSGGGRVTITFDSYTYGQPNPGGAGLSLLLAEFERTHPSITVHAVSVPVADNLTKVEADVAAGAPPDVAQVGWNNAETVAQTLPVRAFADVVGAAAFNQAMAGYDAALLSAAATKDGKIVMLPWLVSTPVLFYNATMFRQAGLNPDVPPATIAQIGQDALAIKAHGVGQGAYIDAVNAPGYSDGVTQSLVDSVGGRLVTPSGQVTLDSAPVVTALSAVQGRLGLAALWHKMATACYRREWGHMSKAVREGVVDEERPPAGQVAVFTDFEYLVLGAGKGLPGRANPVPYAALARLCHEYGNASVRRAYADWADPRFGRCQDDLALKGWT